MGKHKQHKNGDKPEGSLPSDQGEEVIISRQEYEALLAQAEEAQMNRDKALRAMAELENVRKRLEKEKIDSLTYSNQELVRELLPVLDNFQRAMDTAPAEGADDSYREGVKMILKQLKDSLARQGLEEIDAVGKEFDPFFHEAVACVESDTCPAGEVAEEILRGYLFKGRLLRPTAVRVYSQPSRPETPREENETEA